MENNRSAHFRNAGWHFYGETASMKTIVLSRILLLCIVLILQISSYSLLVGEESFSAVENAKLSDMPSEWTELKGEQRIAPIQLMIASVEANGNAISTFQGECMIDVITAVDKTVMAELGYEELLSKNPVSVSRLSVDLISDITANKTFRNARYIDSHYECDGKEIELGNVGQMDCVSVETQSEFVYKQNEMKFPVSTGISELPDYPDIPLNHLVRIEPREWNTFRSLTKVINLHEYYDLEQWGNLRFICAVMEGKKDPKQQERLNETAHVYETTDDAGNRWYRYQRFLENGKLEGNLFWSEISGFMPLCDILTKVSGETVQLQRVKWETVNSVYLPVETLYVRYSKNGEVEHSQRMTISNIKANEPIDSSVFTLKSLDLAEGAMIVNNIQKKIYRYQNGEPVFFSKFYARYKDGQKLLRVTRGRMILVVIGFAMISIGFYLRHSRTAPV